MSARKRHPTLGNPLGARIEMPAKPQLPNPPPPPPPPPPLPQQQPQLSHSPASATAAAAAAAAADTSQASIDNIVTAVRLFSESLLTNRVSKEAQQEVKALAAQMEVLIARRRLSENRSRSPSAAETRLALRNLKRFLEREAVRERAAVAVGGKLQCASCTTDTLDSSCGSQIQAFSSVSDRTQSPGTNSAAEDEDANSVCSDGRGSGGRGDGCRVPSATVTATIVEKMRLRCCLQHQHSHSQSSQAPPPPLAVEQPQSKSKQKRSSRKPQPPPTSLPPSPPPRQLLEPSRQVELICNEQPLFLLPADAIESSESASNAVAHFDQVHLATEFAEVNPLKSNDCEIIRGFQSQPLSLLMMKLQPPVRVERGPLTAANPQLDELQQPPPSPQRGMEVAVEQLAFYEPGMLVTAEPASGGGGGGGWCTSCGRCAVADKALVAEQGNQNCASVGIQQPIPSAISWTARTVTNTPVTTAVRDASNEQLAKGVNKIVSTCSCPSDSDARRAEDNKHTMDKNEEPMDESEEDIEDSSALMPEQQETTKVARQHAGLQATPVMVVQRVCETSSSPERLVSSASLLALMSSGGGGGGSGCDSVEDISWQQPLFRIVDLVRQVRLAAPMTRSRSPPIVDDGSNYDEDVIEVGESNSTMEVLDQSGETNKAAEAAAAAVSLAPTWSSCEFGQSSGFTKLLLTLDKAAKRRREQALARRQRHKKQHQKLSTLSPPTPTPPLQQPQLRSSRKLKSSRHSRRTSRSGNNSSCRRLRCQPPSPQAPSASLRSLSEAMRHQQVALRHAAKSLSGLSRSLRQCVRQVQDAANAVNSSL